jgi:predicted 2-oxoglutarate/Fe(II)-dependent dioxygenase YbiX
MFPLVPYNNFKPTSNWNNFYYFKNVFNDQMIKELEDIVHSNYSFSKGRTGVAELGTDTDSYQTNNRNIAYLTPTAHTKWLYDLLFPLALEANEKLFHFDIDVVTDPIHYVIYPEDGGHLDWHMDVGAYAVNKRKLAMTVQLSASTDYEGGEFIMFQDHEIKLKKGDLLIFPSVFLYPHKVEPVKKGIRYSFISWVW